MRSLALWRLAKTTIECLKEFQDEFFFIWQEYGKESDSQLTQGARELKQLLLSLVHDATA